jgi:hypothetical protein
MSLRELGPGQELAEPKFPLTISYYARLCRYCSLGAADAPELPCELEAGGEDIFGMLDIWPAEPPCGGAIDMVPGGGISCF